MTPGAERILAELPPEGGPADRRDEALGPHRPAPFSHRPARQGDPVPRRQFTREGFDRDDDAGGQGALGARPGAAPPTPAGGRCRTAGATY